MIALVQPTHQIEVFYDGLCPICAKEMRYLKRRDRRDAILFTDVAAADFDPRETGIDGDDLMDRIHARLPNGTTLEGVEVFRRLYTLIGWGPLVVLSRLPGIRQLLDLGYRVFARNRLRLTGRCSDGKCSVPDAPGPSGSR